MPASTRDYGFWHSDPAKAQEFVSILDHAYRVLKAMEPLSYSDAERIFPGIFRILNDEESEIDFDDAWDTLDLLGPRHAAGIPVLAGILVSGNRSEKHRIGYATDYVIKAMGKIDHDGVLVHQTLTPYTQDSNPEVSAAAFQALKSLDHNRSWLSLFFTR